MGAWGYRGWRRRDRIDKIDKIDRIDRIDTGKFPFELFVKHSSLIEFRINTSSSAQTHALSPFQRALHFGVATLHF